MYNKSFVFTILIVCILTIIFILFLFYQRKTIERFEEFHVPKVIWSYWDDLENIPEFVNICIETWRKYNPNYEIILLNKTNLHQYVDIPENIVNHPLFNDSHARFSDLIRFYVLAQNGGVWCDASILLKDSLDNWVFPYPAEFSGYYAGYHQKEGLPPQLITCFFACCTNSPFMKRWRDEFTEISNYNSIEEYLESRRSMGVDFQNIHDPHYLACDIAAQKVFQIDKYPYETLIIRKIEDTALKYLDDANYNQNDALEKACLDKSYQSPIMKVWGFGRSEIINHPDQFSNERCLWAE